MTGCGQQTLYTSLKELQTLTRFLSVAACLADAERVSGTVGLGSDWFGGKVAETRGTDRTCLGRTHRTCQIDSSHMYERA
jgi:hypothetical protein